MLSSSAPARRWRTALVMIARDEAACIQRAIASLRPWVDDCLVLDTGSRDETRSLALAAGARVQAFRWCDDFAAARNAALEAAGADWHIVLDADEWLLDGAPLLAALRHTAPDFVGQVSVDSQQGAGQGVAASWISRVLPAAVRYAGRVHEQAVHTLPVRRLAVHFGHDGYRPEALAAKAGRNAALLAQALQATPDDAYLWYQLGKDHDAYGRFEAAEQALAHAAALLAPGHFPPWHHDLTVRRLHALKRCGRHAEAMQVAEQALPRWDGSPDFHFALGDLLLDWAAEAPGHAEQLLPLIEASWRRCLTLGEHPEHEGAVAGRGSHLAAHNLALLYDTLGQSQHAAAMRARPNPTIGIQP
jgi:tetratricopeptide (TPR) repeat protein